MTQTSTDSSTGGRWSAVGLPFLPSPGQLWNRAILLFSLFVLLYVLDRLSILLGDLWLLQALELESVFWTNFRTGLWLWIIGFVVFLAAAVAPVLTHDLGRVRRWQLIVPGAVIALLGALGLSSNYDAFLLGSQDVGFGQDDPVFGRDLGFYVFDLPYLWVVWTYAVLAAKTNLGFALLCSAIQIKQSDHLSWRGRPITERIGLLATFPVRAGAVVAGILAAFGLWLGRYELLYADNYDSSIHVGADYVDVTGLLSNLNYIYLSIVVVLGIAIIAFIALTRWRERAESGGGRSAPGSMRPLGFALLALVLIDFAFKAGVELRDAVFVKPNEPVIQLDYIAAHIEATRQGAGLEGVERRSYLPGRPGDPLPPIDELLDAAAVRNAPLWPGFSSYLERLLDPQHADRVLLTDGDSMVYGPTLEHFQQKQKLRAYYRMIGVDFVRYDIDGEQRMLTSGVRELPLYEPQPWLGYFGQRYMLFTHGFGMVMAPANEVAEDRGPEFVAYNIPGEYEWPEVELDNERVYYGEGSATMAFSNVDRMKELDYPTEQDRAELFLEDNETTAVAVDSIWKRLVFGWRSGRLVEFLFSDLITDQTRVHFYRRPIERLQRVAPFLFFDSNPYAVSADGKMQWMVNGMSISDRFPYARYGELGDKSDQRSPFPVEHEWVNYVEDSVKATVDAYSGEVSLYRLKPHPIIDTWTQVYPGLFKDISEMPGSLLAQVTYPTQLFHYQFDDLWIYYHMQDPMYFFNLEDMWDDADEVLGPIIDDGKAIRFSIEPYPLILDTESWLPAADADTQYSSVMLFTPEKALNLRGIPIVYQDWPDYGRRTVLEVPKGTYVLGPEQADALIDQDPEISSRFALWNRRGMDILRGHTVMVPFAEEVLYIEPIFLRSRQNPVTQLHKVAVVFRERVAMSDSIGEALREIYARIESGEPPGAMLPAPFEEDPAREELVEREQASQEEGNDD